MAGRWVFGYGSLVSPASFGATLGRELRPGIDVFCADLVGFGRRWNYGVMHTEGTTTDQRGAVRAWTIVALGLIAAEDEAVNGVVGWVDDDELDRLDRRERHYDRVVVTTMTTVHGAGDVSGEIVTYVPRREARRHFEAARAEGRAAVERRYWDLVDAAFASLGAEHHERYHATTPAPDVPVLDLERRPSHWQR